MIQDLTGKVFGRLTIIEHVGFTKNRNARWLCECTCGNTKIITASNLKSGTQSCGCYRQEISGQYNKLDYGEAAFNSIYYNYQRKATSRKLCFELTKEQFRTLTQQKCKYCGVNPHKIHKVNKRVGEYIFNGVDRKDNKEGYTVDNSIACCYTCNRMKHAMTHDDFIAHIKRMAEWQRNIL